MESAFSAAHARPIAAARSAAVVLFRFAPTEGQISPHCIRRAWRLRAAAPWRGSAAVTPSMRSFLTVWMDAPQMQVTARRGVTCQQKACDPSGGLKRQAIQTYGPGASFHYLSAESSL